MEEVLEIWKPVVGYEGLYEVSNLGRVRSLDRMVNHSSGTGMVLHRGKILKEGKQTCGYRSVSLCKDGKSCCYTIHRLVAESFLSNPHNYPIINHKDEDRTNNRVDNLEWCSYSYNNSYGNARLKQRLTMIKKGTCTGLSRKEYMKQYLKEYKRRGRIN